MVIHFLQSHQTNLAPVEDYHISEAGALKLAKAMWWMLARIAGWDGGILLIPVTGITVTGAGGSSTITTDNGTLAAECSDSTDECHNQTVTWTIANGTGQATISTTGLVTAVSNGTVTARATANDGSGVYGTLVITISSQVIPVTGITVTGAGGSSTITTDNGTLAAECSNSTYECHKPDSNMDDSQRHRPGDDQYHRTCHGGIERNSDSKSYGQ